MATMKSVGTWWLPIAAGGLCWLRLPVDAIAQCAVDLRKEDYASPVILYSVLWSTAVFEEARQYRLEGENDCRKIDSVVPLESSLSHTTLQHHGPCRA
jgi:hypothetical protein